MPLPSEEVLEERGLTTSMIRVLRSADQREEDSVKGRCQSILLPLVLLDGFLVVGADSTGGDVMSERSPSSSQASFVSLAYSSNVLERGLTAAPPGGGGLLTEQENSGSSR